MYKIVTIGKKEDILPYQSLGVEIAPVDTAEETSDALRKAVQNPLVVVILITENAAEQCLDTIAELRSKTDKPITIIPTQYGSRRTGMTELEKEIGRTVRMDTSAK